MKVVAVRAASAYLALVLRLSGAWALLFPVHFWDNYPGLGLRFVEPLPAYNEHLLNDFGGLYLGFALLFTVALLRPASELVEPLLAAFLVYSVPHLAFHLLHLEPFAATDAAALLVLVGSFVVVPALLLLAGRRTQRRAPAD